MATITNQIIPVGGYNNIGANWITPITAGQNIIVSDDSVGTAKVVEFDVTNKRTLFQAGGAMLLNSNFLMGASATSGNIDIAKVNAASEVIFGANADTDNTRASLGIDLVADDARVYYSAYLLSSSDSDTSEYNPWASATHTGFSKLERSAKNITFDSPGSGQFQATLAGVYELAFGLAVKGGSEALWTYKIKSLGAVLQSGDLRTPFFSGTAPGIMNVVTTTVVVGVNEYFEVSVESAVGIVVLSGSYVNIKRIG